MNGRGRRRSARPTTSDASSGARRLVGIIVSRESQLAEDDYSGKTHQIAECIAKQRAANNVSVILAFLYEDTL